MAEEADRFIPACAGNGGTWRRKVWGCSVHPRVCGERAGTEMPTRSDHGSSPRVRGTVWRKVVRAVGARFIPACAGNGRACQG